MSNVEAIIAEVKTSLNKYDSAGLINDDTLYREIRLGIKKFGNDVPQFEQETVIEVRGGYAQLPEGFVKLNIAYLCEPLHYKRNNIEHHVLQSSYIWRERVENSTKWNECDAGCCEVKEEKIIRENVYMKQGGHMEFHYHQPQLLKLGKAFKRNLCDPKCKNIHVHDCPYEINLIDQENLQANFNAGSIYIRYDGLPLDENGRIDFPDTFNGKLEQYLEYRLKAKLAEDLIANGDAQGLAQLLPLYMQKEREFAREAEYELKMAKINPQRLIKEFKRLNRLDILTFELVGDWRTNW